MGVYASNCSCVLCTIAICFAAYRDARHPFSFSDFVLANDEMRYQIENGFSHILIRTVGYWLAQRYFYGHRKPPSALCYMPAQTILISYIRSYDDNIPYWDPLVVFSPSLSCPSVLLHVSNLRMLSNMQPNV